MARLLLLFTKLQKKPLAGYWGGVCLKASHFLSLLGDIAQFAVFIPANNNKE